MQRVEERSGKRPRKNALRAIAKSKSLGARDRKCLCIFLVEDHADTREWMSIWMEELGYRVVPVATMAEAERKWPAADCHVLLCDVGLPDGSGWELLKRLKPKKPLLAVA